MEQTSNRNLKTVTIPEPIYVEFKKYCKENGLVIKTIVGMLIKDYMKNNQ